MQTSNTVILVVEDEALIRMDVVNQLNEQGYAILEAETGREALEEIANADIVNLLFTDIDMPGDLDGVRLAHEVSRSWPEMGIIVTSGMAPPGMGILPKGSRFFSKPYSPELVHAAIREMLPHPS